MGTQVVGSMQYDFHEPLKIMSAQTLAATVTPAQVFKKAGFLHADVMAVISGGGAPVGTLGVEGSLDGTNFKLIQTATSISGDGTYLIPLTDCRFPFLRFVYTRTSGTGAMDLWVSANR